MKLATMLASSILGVALSGACLADTVYMRDGTEVEGTIVEDNPNTVVIKLNNGVTRSYRRDDVDTVVKSPRVMVAAPAAEPRPNPGAEPASGPGADGAGKTEDKSGKDKADKGDKDKPGADKKDGEEDDKKWTPPPGLESFPDHAKRMPADQEKIFMDALEKLSDQKTLEQAKSDIAALGKDALPYVIAGLQHDSVYTRTACMQMIPAMDGQRAIKQVVEVFYAAMPAGDGRAAPFQVPFIDAIKTTISGLTGQSFITTDSKNPLIQTALKQYIDWYNTNMMTLQPQLGEKKVSKTDPDYLKKLSDSRQLKLEKRAWSQPAGGQDDLQQDGRPVIRPPLNESNTQRQADKDYEKSFQKVDRNDALKRPQDKLNDQNNQ